MDREDRSWIRDQWAVEEGLGWMDDAGEVHYEINWAAAIEEIDSQTTYEGMKRWCEDEKHRALIAEEEAAARLPDPESPFSPEEMEEMRESCSPFSGEEMEEMRERSAPFSPEEMEEMLPSYA
jgi:hypothetical protein